MNLPCWMSLLCWLSWGCRGPRLGYPDRVEDLLIINHCFCSSRYGVGGWGTSCNDLHRWVGVQPSAACTQANCEDRLYINWNWPRFSTVCVSPFPISALHTHHPSLMLWRFEKTLKFVTIYFRFDRGKSKKKKGAALLNITTLITDNEIQWGIHY